MPAIQEFRPITPDYYVHPFCPVRRSFPDSSAPIETLSFGGFDDERHILIPGGWVSTTPPEYGALEPNFVVSMKPEVRGGFEVLDKLGVLDEQNVGLRRNFVRSLQTYLGLTDFYFETENGAFVDIGERRFYPYKIEPALLSGDIGSMSGEWRRTQDQWLVRVSQNEEAERMAFDVQMPTMELIYTPPGTSTFYMVRIAVWAGLELPFLPHETIAGSIDQLIKDGSDLDTIRRRYFTPYLSVQLV